MATIVLNIVHFNDVYQIEARSTDPCGGASRFAQVVEEMRQSLSPPPIVLFSGDAFSPSTHSTVTKGKHMVPVLNSFEINCAAAGNHDFDYGFDVAASLMSQCNFPWLLSNVVSGATGLPVAGTKKYHTTFYEGLTIGFIGLAERDWIDTLAYLPPGGLQYLDMIAEGKRLVSWLRSKPSKPLKPAEMCDVCDAKEDLDSDSGPGCDLVIALTHMRQPNDILCASALDVDFVLGGHDHDYFCSSVDGKLVLKSGSDFRSLSLIRVCLSRELIASPSAANSSSSHLNPQGPWFTNHYPAGRDDGRDDGWQVQCAVHRIDINANMPEKPMMQSLVEELCGNINLAMDKEIVFTNTDLDVRFAAARTGECNFGNYVADVVRLTYDVDVAFLCGGTLRSDSIYAAGAVPIRTLLLCLPFEDPTVILRLTGQQLLTALENGVANYPNQDGRFPQVSGLRFCFNPLAPSGERVTSVSIFQPARRSSTARAAAREVCDSFIRRQSSLTLTDEPTKSLFLGRCGSWTQLDLSLQYTVATRSYLAAGRDGYDVFLSGQVLMDSERGHILSSLVRNHCSALKVVSRWRARALDRTVALEAALKAAACDNAACDNGLALAFWHAHWNTEWRHPMQDRAAAQLLTLRTHELRLAEPSLPVPTALLVARIALTWLWRSRGYPPVPPHQTTSNERDLLVRRASPMPSPLASPPAFAPSPSSSLLFSSSPSPMMIAQRARAAGLGLISPVCDGRIQMVENKGSA